MAKTHSTRIDFEKDEVAGLMQKIRNSGLKIKKGYPFYKICANSSEPEKELGEIDACSEDFHLYVREIEDNPLKRIAVEYLK